jgi:hypothetical protein
MVLTEEQKERIKKNRERALEIRRKKQEEKEKQEANATATATTAVATTTVVAVEKEQKANANDVSSKSKKDKEELEVELEDFEIGASEYISKSTAMKLYCLPPGTLAVCTYVEKDNPRQSKWNKMKLYERADIRKRARKRFGGLDGLIQERKRREMKRFEKDFESASDVFRTSSSTSTSTPANKKQKR